MKVLSIRSPWWWWIFHGKNIENRGQRFNPTYRGPLLIHASSSYNQREQTLHSAAASTMADKHYADVRNMRAPVQPFIRHLNEKAGHIVGCVDLVDVVTESDSAWFVGPHGLVLKNPMLFETPVRMKGVLGLFDPTPNILAAVITQLKGHK